MCTKVADFLFNGILFEYCFEILKYFFKKLKKLTTNNDIVIYWIKKKALPINTLRNSWTLFRIVLDSKYNKECTSFTMICFFFYSRYCLNQKLQHFVGTSVHKTLAIVDVLKILFFDFSFCLLHNWKNKTLFVNCIS